MLTDQHGHFLTKAVPTLNKIDNLCVRFSLRIKHLGRDNNAKLTVSCL